MPTPEGQEFIDRYRLMNLLKMISRRDRNIVLLQGMVDWTNKLDEADVRRCAKELAVILDQPDLPAFTERFLAKQRWK